MTFYILQEDGASKLTLEDGSGALITEDAVAAAATPPILVMSPRIGV